MLFIEHGIKTLADLRRTPTSHGVAIDVRDYDGSLRIAHEPFESGEVLMEFLSQFRHAQLLINVHGSGLIPPTRELLHRFNITKYLFHNLTGAESVQMARLGIAQFAARFSDYEPLESAMMLAGKAKWVCVDCFDRFPLNAKSYAKLQSAFQICLVSPEINGGAGDEIGEIRREIEKMPPDAIWTARREDWIR